jgi:hypothetical protein
MIFPSLLFRYAEKVFILLLQFKFDTLSFPCDLSSNGQEKKSISFDDQKKVRLLFRKKKRESYKEQVKGVTVKRGRRRHKLLGIKCSHEKKQEEDSDHDGRSMRIRCCSTASTDASVDRKERRRRMITNNTQTSRPFSIF